MRSRSRARAVLGCASALLVASVAASREQPPDLAPSPPLTETSPPLAHAEATGAGSNGEAGWYPGFAILSRDEDFRLRLGLQAAYRFEPHWLDGEAQDRRTFFVVRPILAGHLFEPWIRFWTSVELASNPPFLLDSYIELRPLPEFGVRLGQQATPLSRHQSFGPHEILFADWSAVAGYFWSGRDKGVTLAGTLADGVIDYWLGAYTGTPVRQFDAIDGNYLLEARVTINPMGPAATNEAMYITSEEPVPFRLSFTVQGFHGNVETAVENFNPSAFRFDAESSGNRREQTLGSADIWLQSRSVSALAEGYVRRTNPSGAEPSYTSLGVWGQVGVMVIDRLVDVGVRANLIQANTNLDDDLFYSLEGHAGYYPFRSQRFVLKFRYGYAKQRDPGVSDAPLYAIPGNHHVATLQLGLAL